MDNKQIVQTKEPYDFYYFCSKQRETLAYPENGQFLVRFQLSVSILTQ